MRLLGLGVCGLGIVGVGLLAAAEGFYRSLLPDEPPPGWPPTLEGTQRLPAKLAQARWSVLERGNTLTVEPAWPWTLVTTVTRVLMTSPPFAGEQEGPPPGWSLARDVVSAWAASSSRVEEVSPREEEDEPWHEDAAGSSRGNEPHHLRAMERLAMSLWLTRSWSAEDMLAFEARWVRLGHGVTGLSEAARRYLGKELAELTNAEAALLAALGGLNRSTQRQHPECFVEDLHQRRAQVLSRMREAGVLTPQEEATARSEAIVFRSEDHPCPP